MHMHKAPSCEWSHCKWWAWPVGGATPWECTRCGSWCPAQPVASAQDGLPCTRQAAAYTRVWPPLWSDVKLFIIMVIHCYGGQYFMLVRTVELSKVLYSGKFLQGANSVIFMCTVEARNSHMFTAAPTDYPRSQAGMGMENTATSYIENGFQTTKRLERRRYLKSGGIGNPPKVVRDKGMAWWLEL